MKKFIGTIALATIMATSAIAQTPTIPVLGCSSEYVVRQGDTLWELAELKLNNPTLWGWLVEQNPVLQEPGRQFVREDGTEIVRIYPGEELYCLKDVGIQFSEQTPVEIEVATPPSTQEVITVSGKVENSNFFVADYWWLWLLLLLALAVAGRKLWEHFESRKDPIYSRPPQVEGGVGTVDEARQHFSSRYNNFTILSVVPGTIYGTMNVRYGDGTERPRIMNGQRAYQAQIRRPNGETDSIYMLMACGNDLRFGDITNYQPGRNFRFVPDVTEAQAAEQPEAQPSRTEESTVEATVEGELKIELKPAEQPGGTALVRVTGVSTRDLTLTVGSQSVTLRYHPEG